jgi:hypothetical protein
VNSHDYCTDFSFSETFCFCVDFGGNVFSYQLVFQFAIFQILILPLTSCALKNVTYSMKLLLFYMY